MGPGVGGSSLVARLKGGMIRTAGRLRLRRDLHALHMQLPDRAPDAASPVLYVSNHASWWDGFLVQRLHDSWRDGPLVTVVDQGHLLRHPALAAAGCVGVDRTSLASLRTLLRTVGDRSRIKGMGVSLFPQGNIQSSRKRPLGFERGLDPIANAMGSPWIVPAAIHAELLNHRRPTVFVLVGEPYAWHASRGVDEAEDRVRDLLDLIQRDVDERGEFTPQGWATRMRQTERNTGATAGPGPNFKTPGEGASA